MKKYFAFPLLSILAAFALPAAAHADRDGWHRGGHHDNGRHYYNDHRPIRNGLQVFIGSQRPVYYYPPRVQYVAVPQPVYITAPAPAPVMAQNNSYCREFTRNIVIGGQVRQGYGNACQQPDGSWEIVD